MTTLVFGEKRHGEMVWHTAHSGREAWLAPAAVILLDDEEHGHYETVPAPEPRWFTTTPVADVWLDIVSAVTKAIHELISYPNLGTVEARIVQLLGPIGLAVLDQLAGLVYSTAAKNSWPLEGVEWHVSEDPQVEDSRLLVVTLKLSSTFEQADLILKGFYGTIQEMADTLPGKARQIFFEKIYVDIELV